MMDYKKVLEKLEQLADEKEYRRTQSRRHRLILLWTILALTLFLAWACINNINLV